MELFEVESRLKFTFPARHRQAILDSSDPIHKACNFLALSDGQHGDILPENEWIHGPEFGDPWPDFLIAFASNGCGDYFAYDTRQIPATIIYIDPDETVKENLQSSEKLCYETFEKWYESTMERYTCSVCQSREVRFEVSEDKKFLLRVCPNCGFQERTKAIEP
jgi:DNA-directed RNA polymerase subunit RPC12/RpoP